MTQKETEALIRLLDDPDKTVYRAVRKKILEEGAGILPDITRAWHEAKENGNDDTLLMSRYESIVPKLQNDLIIDLIEQWINQPDDLRQIAWLVSRMDNFALGREEFDKSLDSLKPMLPALSPDNFTPLEQVKIFNKTFFNKMGFKPVKAKDYFKPQGCFPNKVITSKEGNPVSLALVYMILATEAGLPIQGVNLPKNFILAYVEEPQKVSFYITPLSMGAVFEKAEIDTFLQNIELKPEQQFYVPCDYATIAKRLLCHLALAYLIHGDKRNSAFARRALGCLGTPLSNGIDWE